MKHFDIDLDAVDFADELIRNIEKDYGRSVARIPFFQAAEEPHTYDLKIIFTDFRLLEAKVRVVQMFSFPSIQVQGTYY